MAAHSSEWLNAARALSAIILTVALSAILLIIYLDPKNTDPALAIIISGGSLILTLLGIDLGPWLANLLGRGERDRYDPPNNRQHYEQEYHRREHPGPRRQPPYDPYRDRDDTDEWDADDSRHADRERR